MGSLYGFEIKSDLPLRRLNAAAGRRGVLEVVRAAGPLPSPSGEPAGVLEDERGRRWYASWELDGDRCLLELPPTGAFLLDPGAGRIVVDADGDDEELLEHRLASSALCTLLSMREDLVLHAAAVELDGRALVFCGPSLRGKSTLARALGESGCRLLGEDGVAIELGDGEPLAHPGARGVRARRAGRGGRIRTELLADPGPGEPHACPVAAIVLLDRRGQRFAGEPLAPARALALLTSNLVHSGGRAAIGTAFQRLARLLAPVPAFSASLADDLAALPEATQDLLDLVGIRS